MYGRSDAPSVIGTYDVDVNYDQNCEDFPYGPPACNSNRENLSMKANKQNTHGILMKILL